MILVFLKYIGINRFDRVRVCRIEHKSIQLRDQKSVNSESYKRHIYEFDLAISTAKDLVASDTRSAVSGFGDLGNDLALLVASSITDWARSSPNAAGS